MSRPRRPEVFGLKSGAPTPTPTSTARLQLRALGHVVIFAGQRRDGLGHGEHRDAYKSPSVTWKTLHRRKYLGSAASTSAGIDHVANGSHTNQSRWKESSGVVATASITVTVANGVPNPRRRLLQPAELPRPRRRLGERGNSFAANARRSRHGEIDDQYQSPPVS